jgi:serine protease AprX
MQKLIAVLLVCSVVLGSSLAYGDDSKISPDLRGYHSNSKVQVIVQYAPNAKMNCGGLLGLLGCVVGDVLKLGGAVLNALPLVNGLVASLDGNGIINLSNQPDVLYISKDRPVSLLMDSAAPAVNAPVAWKSSYTGSGVGVAVIDSGVNKHKDLDGTGWFASSRVAYNQSFLSTGSTADQYGHGTHIAGLIAGNGASSTGSQYSQTFKGIAPDAKILNLRVLDAKGAGTDSSVIAAI